MAVEDLGPLTQFFHLSCSPLSRDEGASSEKEKRERAREKQIQKTRERERERERDVCVFEGMRENAPKIQYFTTKYPISSFFPKMIKTARKLLCSC